MARRIKYKNVYAGQRSHGAGNIKRRRGKGSRGGVGRAGYHKHRWLYTVKYENAARDRKPGFASPTTVDYDEVTLETIQRGIDKGTYQKDASGSYHIDLSGRRKVLSNGALDAKIVVKAAKFSKAAKEKIEKAGGQAVIAPIKTPLRVKPSNA
ncbi:MAG TPA: uL15 family ribosomal protein [Candidatus Norongarragalinales archaeon]|jgi:large subunit ribosomal protein L15|nr:uL15 family ribosomal protein [Candidatus Norongarragalinales archaeon]